MHKHLLAVMSLLLLTGCWDQRLLKDTRLIYSAAFDLEGEGIRDTVVIRTIPSSRKEHEENEIITVTGKTIRESKEFIDQRISGTFGAAKVQVFLFGEDLAKKDIYSVVDVLFRDPASALGAKVAVTEGKAQDILNLRKKGLTLISEHIRELLESEEDSSVLPFQTMQIVSTSLLDEGKDFGLPYLKYDTENNGIVLNGLALFNNRSFTGKILTPEQSKVVLLMSRNENPESFFTKKVSDNEDNWLKNYVSFTITKTKNDTNITVSNDHIAAHINIDLSVNVTEYPHNQLQEKATTTFLNERLSEIFTEEATLLIEELQEANSDVFGFGRDLLAYHSDHLEDGKLAENYFQDMDISAEFSVKISNTGIKN